jgi:hypothetical protein
MTRVSIQPGPTRAALERLPIVAAQESLEPPPLENIYVPAGHQQALSLDAGIVVGMRGAGKSLWTAVLSTDRHREFVAVLAGNSALQRAVVRVGFGQDTSNTLFPSQPVLAQLARANIEPFSVWQAVVLRHALSAAALEDPLGKTWLEAVRLVQKSPERAEQLLSESDARLSQRGQVLLVLFDALENLGADWPSVRLWLTAALRFALASRSRRSIRMKFFLRPDMEEDAEIWKFPDSSKLRHARVELAWRSADLYAVVLHFLANDAKSGSGFRSAAIDAAEIPWVEHSGVFSVPRALLADDQRLLRPIVEGITGPWIGRSHKRGFAYTWIPLHLADAAGRVSPRSVLLAFRYAAAETAQFHPDHQNALHFEAIQHGVAEASRIRRAEIEEDYPWVEPLLEAARGLSVPCSPRDLIERWTADSLQGVRSTAARKLPPRRFTTDPNRRGQKDVLVDDLVELAVLYRTGDGRVNMPDIFRVGFGILRKGGVKPPQ